MNITNLFMIFLAICLALVNAFFVAAEFSLVKVRATRVQALKDDSGLSGRILYLIHPQLDAFLSVCQLGITLASLGLGWIGEPAFAHILNPVFELFMITSVPAIKAISLVTAFAIITFLHIVVGELVPKSLAIRRAEIVAIWTAVPLYVCYWIMYPAIYVLNACSNLILRIIGIGVAHKESLYSAEEIKLIIDVGHQSGQFTEEQAEMIEHTIDLTDLEVQEIMRPMSELVILYDNQPIKEILKAISAHKYSRYPLFDAKSNEPIGIIHVKDVFAYLLEGREIDNISSIMRPILKVQHNLPAVNLVHKFRDSETHLALVYEYKAVRGFVTMDNLFHVFIGKINDEFHRTHDDWVINQEGAIIAKGSCSLYYLERALDSDIVLDDDEDDLGSISELVIKRLGKAPQYGDTVQINDRTLVVQETKNGTIVKVIIMPPSAPE